MRRVVLLRGRAVDGGKASPKGRAKGEIVWKRSKGKIC